MNNPIVTQQEKAVREFEEKFIRPEFIMRLSHRLKVYDNKVAMEDISNHIRTSALSLLDAVVEVVENMKQKEHKCLDAPDEEYDWTEGCPREIANATIANFITTIKEAKEQVEK